MAERSFGIDGQAAIQGISLQASVHVYTNKKVRLNGIKAAIKICQPISELKKRSCVRDV